MTDYVTLLLVTIIAFLIAGMVKGVMGMGLPTVAMGLLSIIVPPVQAAALLVAPNFVTNAWQAVTGPALARLAWRLAPLFIGVWGGIYVSIGVLTRGNVAAASAALGLVLAAYGLFGLRVSRPFVVTRRSERWMSPLIGGVTGLITGATGIFVIPAVPYLNSLGLERDELIQALGLSFISASLGMGVGLATGGALTLAHVGTSLIAVIPAMGGMFLGQRIRVKLPPATFRKWFFIGLTALGGYMLVRSAVLLARQA